MEGQKKEDKPKKILTTSGVLLLAIFSIAFIILLNYSIISGWFGKNGPANIGSIEVSYISMARFINDFSFQSWAPFWYFGFPFHLFYTPLLPILEAVVNKSFGVPLWETYRLLTGLAYVLGPVSVFFLGWQLSRRISGGLIAAVIYTVAPTIFYFLDSGVAGDRFSVDFWDPRRFTLLVRWGEGPHIVSLVFMPLIGVFFARALSEHKFRWILLTALFLGLTALTNAIGLFAGLLLIASMGFVAFSQKQKNMKQVIFQTLFVGMLALGLISFWYNLSFVSNFFGEGGGSINLLVSLFPWGWVGALFAVLLLHLVFRKYIKDFGIAFSIVWFLLFFLVVYVYYTQGVELLPQALRYNVEVDLSLSVLIGVLFAKLFRFLSGRKKVFTLIEMGLAVVIVVGLGIYIQPFLETAHRATSVSVDLAKTSEYRIATWLKDNIDVKSGERVFLPGNYGFYANWFTDVWQVRGGLFQAATHYWPDHMYYQMTNGRDAQISHAWFVITNVKYAVITTAASGELYKEIKKPQRFEQYPVVSRENGDVIYNVPLVRPSISKPVRRDTMSSLAVPKKADDKKALLAYTDWVENSSKNQATFRMVDHDTYSVTGEVAQGEGILVQMTADSGWSARDAISGETVKVGRDPMGFIMLYPSTGAVDITLKHGLIWQQWLGYFLSIATVIFVVWYGFIGKKKYPVFLRVNTSKKEAEE